MEFGSTILHNVESLIWDEEAGDYLLCRVPEPTRLGLNMKAQKNILFASNSEIRFVMKGDSAVLGLRRMPAKGDIRSQGVLEVFQGDYQGSYEISPWSVTADRTEITIRRQDWSAVQRFEMCIRDSPWSRKFPSLSRIKNRSSWELVLISCFNCSSYILTMTTPLNMLSFLK